MKLDINQFTNQELINAIVKYMRADENKYACVAIITDELEDGSWLDFYQKQLDEEK